MDTYNSPDWLTEHEKRFEKWWNAYLRKREDKTELAKSIARDAWLACREDAEMTVKGW